MVSADLKIAFRILKKHRLSSVITIVGLGLGLAIFALLAAFVRDELSFDRFHAKADRLYLLTNEFRGRFSGESHHFIAEILESGYPEVRPGAAVRYAASRLPIRPTPPEEGRSGRTRRF